MKQGPRGSGSTCAFPTRDHCVQLVGVPRAGQTVWETGLVPYYMCTSSGRWPLALLIQEDAFGRC
jgi:hypothetical protein